MADEWKYGQQPLDRPEGSPSYAENTPLMRPMSDDLLLRWEHREPPVSARLEPQEAPPPQNVAPFQNVSPPQNAAPPQNISPPQNFAPPQSVSSPQSVAPPQAAAYAQDTSPPWSPPGGTPSPAPPPHNVYEQAPAAPPWAGYYPPYGAPQGYQLPVPYGFYPYGLPLPYGAVPYGASPGHPGGLPPTEGAPGQAAPAPFYWVPQAPGPFAPAGQPAESQAVQPIHPSQPVQPAQPTQPAWAQPQPPQPEPPEPQPSFSPPGSMPASPAPQPSLAPQPPPSFAWDEEEDWEDEEDPAFKVLPQAPLPTPATVPVTPPMAKARKKRRNGLLPLILSVLVLGSAMALYFTGAVDSQLQAVNIPTWSETLARLRTREAASTLSQETPGQEGVRPLEEVLAEPRSDGSPPSANLAHLRSFGVSLREAQAPATLVFTLRTNSAVSDIRLLLPDNRPLTVSNVNKTPTADGILWQLAVDFKEPFEGDISAFLRYDASVWADGGLNCTVAVKAP